jgi:N-acetylmuramoyl-L-alanine amidase
MRAEISLRFRCFIVLLGLQLLAASAALAQPLVVLDPGHGGSDPGAVGCGLQEDDGVLDVSLRLRTLLEAAGVRVAMTREIDTSVGLSARASFANAMNADVFVSNHSNANSGTPASGTETFVATSASARSVTLATLIQDELVATWGLPDRGVKYADFVVVRDTNMPAALAELAFTNRCTPDAALLASPTARQDIAGAEARAILEWLGIAPSETGEVRGVVFEDQGVGTEDLTVRLPGAIVTVIETSASATADSPDGNWSFDVPSGSYTIEASAPGHVTNRRTCVVTGGATTWCSIGLFPTSTEPDAGMALEDAGPMIEAGASSDAGPIEIDAGETDVDAGTTMRGTSSCGCRAGSASPRGGWLVVLVFGLLLVRRRRARALALVLLAGCTGAAEAPAAIEALEPSTELEASERVESFATLGAMHHFVLEGAVEGPVLSPDGRFVLLPSADRRSLHVLDVATGEQRTLLSGPAVGLAPRWQPDGSVAVHGPGQSDTSIPMRAVTLDGQATPVLLGTHGVHTWVETGEGEDAVRYRDGHSIRTISRGGDRYLSPSLSSDGAWITYWGAVSGVMVFSPAAQRTWVLGDPLLSAGHFGHPEFDASGRYLVFEHTTDEGHVFTGGDIEIVDLASMRRMTLTDGAVIARQPTLSRIEGARGRVAFLVDGGLLVAELIVSDE